MERAIALKGGQNMSVSRWVLQTKLGRYKTEREMGKCKIPRVQKKQCNLEREWAGC